MRRPARLLCTLAAAVALLGGCAPETEGPSGGPAPSDSAAGAPTAAASTDPDPDSLDLTRVVTIGGPVTEIVYAFGLGENVVGTDRSSLYPESVNAKPRLDYFRQTSAEGVLSLRPTLVLAVDGTGPPGVVEQIRAAGVPVVVLDEAVTVAGAEARIQRLGRLLGREAQADSTVDAMRRSLAAAEADRPAEASRALFVYT
ncbi:MAG TPA: ABC transporter substrate-binding protein, partial [Rubricoccaceae bacterium]